MIKSSDNGEGDSCRALWMFFVVAVHSVMCDFCDPHGLRHTRLPCPSLSPGVCSNSRPLSQWCHPTISSSFAPFSSCLQSFPASGSFPVSRLFASGGQSIGASASVLPVNIQGWFPLGFPLGLISLLSKGHSRVSSSSNVTELCIFKRLEWFLKNPKNWSSKKRINHSNDTALKLAGNGCTYLWIY